MAIAAVNIKIKKSGEGKSLFQYVNNLNLKTFFPSRVSPREIIFFTSQLSLMVEIGTPLNVCLSTIAGQIKNPALKQAIKEVVTEVEGGKLLSDVLGRYPHMFSDVYISLVRAGENTGQLREMLDRVVEIQEKQDRFVDQIKKAMSYPAILCLMSISVVVFLLAYVFPKFATLFEEIKDILPASTKFLIWLSNFMRSYWHITAALLGISGGGIYIFLKSNKGKMLIDRLKITAPLLANIYIRIYLIQAMRTLGFLMNCNVPMIEALSITRAGINNLVFAGFIDKVTENVESGKGMSIAFIESDFIPENARQVIKTGEDTQNLSKVMLRLSDYYEIELNDQMKKFTTIVEPLMLIIMGIVVGTIVISLIMPIFKLTRGAH